MSASTAVNDLMRDSRLTKSVSLMYLAHTQAWIEIVADLSQMKPTAWFAERAVHPDGRHLSRPNWVDIDAIDSEELVGVVTNR